MWSENRQLLIRGARALGDLCHEFVFVGGCTTGLFITDAAAPDVRATRDVDVIAEVTSRAEYYAIAKRLRTRGFKEDLDVICRWRSEEGLILDVMPTDPDILGFSNVWYRGAVTHATKNPIAPGTTIRVVTPPYFCATKIAAFHGRGKGDYAASHDLEDFLAVVDGRVELAAEIDSAEPDVRHYVATEVTAFLSESGFIDVLPGYLPPDTASQQRLPLLLQRLRRIASAV